MGGLRSGNGFLIYSLICGIGMIISYRLKDSKIPFLKKQLESFIEVHKYLAMAFSSIFLLLTYGSFLKGLARLDINNLSRYNQSQPPAQFNDLVINFRPIF